MAAGKRKKLVLIGAGSAMFTQGLVADLLNAQAQAQGPWELALVDIDAEALETAQLLARKMVEAREADIPISWSTDRRDLLPGAHAVVTTIAVGKRRAWEADVFIPRKYGVFQPVGDTTMPGGISRALRMIPAMLDIARDVVSLCPDACFMNYSNPMTAICTAVARATGATMTGLCHGVNHIEGYMAEQAGCHRSRVTSLAVGLNHLTFMTEFRCDGEDAWPAVSLNAGRADQPFSWSLFDAYGAYPCVSDRHVTEFFPERFPGGSYYGRTLGVDAFSFEETIRWGDESYESMGRQARGEAPLDKGLFSRAEGEHEQLLDILASISGDRRQVFSVNLPNGGAVPNLPANAILELPAAATAGGFRQLAIPDFPQALAAIITRRLLPVELTVEAALTGSRPMLVEALLADGAVTDRAVAGRLADELLAAHKGSLPQFA